jgi:hypothetical protein
MFAHLHAPHPTTAALVRTLHHCCASTKFLTAAPETHPASPYSSIPLLQTYCVTTSNFVTNTSIKRTCFVPLLTSADCSCEQIHDGIRRAWSSGHSRISHRRRHHCVQRLPKLGEGGLCGPAMHDQGPACCCTTTYAHRRRCPSRWPFTLTRIASLKMATHTRTHRVPELRWVP